MSEPLDELFGQSTPVELDINKTDKFFDDLERAIKFAVKDNKYTEDDQCKESINNIENEFYWFYDKYKELMSAYEDTKDLLDFYRGETESRLDPEEQYVLNAIKVKQKLEKSK